MPEQTPYAPANLCIYCDKRRPEVELSKEHIVADGLKGNLVFPKASCTGEKTEVKGRYATITSRFEREYMQGAYDGLRTFLGVFGTRRKKDRRTEIPLIMEGEEYENLPPDQHPFWAAFFLFEPAELLSGRRSRRTVSLKIIKMAEDRIIQGYLEKYIPVVGIYNSTPTIRMLAKVAHSYAMAEYRPRSFTPFLPDIILDDGWNKSAELWPQFIGTASQGQTLSPNLHELRLESRKINGRFLIICTVRLFTCIPDAPTHEIVVGEHWHSSFSLRTASIQLPIAPAAAH